MTTGSHKERGSDSQAVGLSPVILADALNGAKTVLVGEHCESLGSMHVPLICRGTYAAPHPISTTSHGLLLLASVVQLDA